jgi:hypothetical protein
MGGRGKIRKKNGRERRGKVRKEKGQHTDKKENKTFYHI